MGSLDERDIVLRVVRGHSDAPQFLLTGGDAKRAFSIGRDGEWKIDAADVAGEHVWLAFNGKTLYACACPGETATLGGVELGAQWLEVPVPIELRFGAARIVVGRRATQDEETMVRATGDVDEPTSVNDVLMPVRGQRDDDEVTRFDESRLRGALRRGSSEEGVTCYAPLELAAPVAAPVAFPRRTSKLSVPSSLAAPSVHVPQPLRDTPLPLTPPPLPPPVVLTPPLAPAPAPPPMRRPDTPSSAWPSRRPDALPRGAVPPPAPSWAWPSLQPLPRSAMALAAANGQVSSAHLRIADLQQRPSISFAPPARSMAMSGAMPATLPSDELVAAARDAHPKTGAIRVAMPASVTMATPNGYELPAARRTPQSESRATASGNQPVPASIIMSTERPRAVSRPTGGAISKKLLAEWKAASTPKKIIAGLLAPTLLAVLAVAQPAPRPAPVHASTTTVTNAASSASVAAAPPALPLPAAVPAPLPAALPSASAVAATTPSKPAAKQASKGDAPAREVRTPERRALDAAASGDAVAAAEQYETLAQWHPDNVAYREAARIFRARAGGNAKKN